MSLADDLNTGGVVDAMAARFAAADAARAAELDRLIKAGKGNVEPPWRGREGGMPKGKPSAKRTCCESKGTRHLASCPTMAKRVENDPARSQAFWDASLRKANGKVAAPKVTVNVQAVDHAQVRQVLMDRSQDVQVATLGVEQLLALVADAKKELARRRDEARSLASKLETALEELGQ